MKKTFIILTTLALAASCTEQDLPAPLAPPAADSDVLIVPALSIAAIGSGEATAPYRATAPATRVGTAPATRAAVYDKPYVIADALGRKTIVVTHDKNGAISKPAHPRWQQTPDHNPNTKIDNVNIWGSVSPYFEVAQTTTGPVAWGTTNAHCTAPWRRPTVAELEWTYTVHTELDLKEPFNATGTYWAATEWHTDNTKGYYVRFSDGLPATGPKTDSRNIRCVRDAYPYIAPNAEGKMSVIVAQDEYGNAGAPMHSPWTQTPAGHTETSPQNSLSYRFEVAQDDAYTSAIIGTSLASSTCPNTWRLPTEREMLAIVKLRDQLTGITPLTPASGATTPITYWTYTRWSGSVDHYWYTEQKDKIGITDHAVNTNHAHLRCVRDVYDPMPAATNVATMWTYDNTAVGSGIYVPNTYIKSSGTGFELADPQYYPADGNKKLYFYAYAPTDNYSGNYGTGICNHLFTGKTDVLWAKDTRGIAKNSNPALQEQPFFRFRHQLMQLRFRFVADPSFPPAGQAVTNITVKGVNNLISTDMRTGSATFSTKDSSIPFSASFTLAPSSGNIVSAAGTVLSETLLIQPSKTVTLSITVGGITYPDITVTLKGTAPDTPGKSHLITLTLKRNEIVPTAAASEWTEGGKDDIEVV